MTILFDHWAFIWPLPYKWSWHMKHMIEMNIFMTCTFEDTWLQTYEVLYKWYILHYIITLSHYVLVLALNVNRIQDWKKVDVCTVLRNTSVKGPSCLNSLCNGHSKASKDISSRPPVYIHLGKKSEKQTNTFWLNRSLAFQIDVRTMHNVLFVQYDSPVSEIAL